MAGIDLNFMERYTEDLDTNIKRYVGEKIAPIECSRSNGTYVLLCQRSNGTSTYTWVDLHVLKELLSEA